MRNKLKAKVFELDISPDAYLANPKTDRNFVLGDYTKLPYNDLSFDFIHLKDAIEHMPNKQGLFLETFRVLKPGKQRTSKNNFTFGLTFLDGL
jgi:ubiquinone/menaquinone biosynthesis C-methylase UbiE